ncbi:MAG: hypothetical protein SVG88_02280 [Halobacteriales archaeon]|nr:hypothetical protein [Halobacteriales archaeon]
MSDDSYVFDGLPLDGIRAGSTVLVAGPTHGGMRALGYRMLVGPAGEGAIIVTTNRRASRIVDDSRQAGLEIQEDSTGIVDCVGSEEQRVPARLLSVGGPSDLTGIGMRFSDLYMEFKRAGVNRVRTGLYSVSTLLAYSDLRTVSRFIHTLIGRIDKVDGLGILCIDPSNHDEQAVNTLSQFCTGTITVRETTAGVELRASGLPNQTREWTQFDLTAD